MSQEDYKSLAEWVVFNNLLLQSIAYKIYGTEGGNMVIDECIKQTRKQMKIAEKKGKKKGI